MKFTCGSAENLRRAKYVAGAIAIALLPQTVHANDTVKLGTMQSLTGDAQSIGTVFAQSLQLAIDEINADGGILGKQLELVIEDSRCTGPNAVNAYTKLTEVDNVKIIFGATCSGEFLAVADRFDKDQVIGLANVSHPDVATGHPYIFRNGPNSESDGRATARGIAEDGVKTVVTITQETDFAEGFRKATVKYLESLGVEVIDENRVRVGEIDFRPTLTRTLASDPDAILLAAQTEEACGALARQARELGYAGRLYGTTLCTGRVASDLAKENLTGLRAVIPPFIEAENTRGQEFLKAFREKHGFTTEEFFMAAAYDEVYLVKHCAEETGTLDDTSRLKMCLDNLENFEGTIGTYHFDDEGEIVGVSPVLVEVLPYEERSQETGVYKLVSN